MEQQASPFSAEKNDVTQSDLSFFRWLGGELLRIKGVLINLYV